MFLFADLALPEAIPEWKVSELEDDNIVQRTTSKHSMYPRIQGLRAMTSIHPWVMI